MLAIFLVQGFDAIRLGFAHFELQK